MPDLSIAVAVIAWGSKRQYVYAMKLPALGKLPMTRDAPSAILCRVKIDFKGHDILLMSAT